MDKQHFVFFRDIVNRDRMYTPVSADDFARLERIRDDAACPYGPDVEAGKICGEHLPAADADWVEELRMASDFSADLGRDRISAARSAGRIITVEYP